MQNRLSVWGVRLLTGMTLLYCSEIVWWSNNPTEYELPAWIALVVLYVAFGALVLDLLVRFKIGELYGLLLVVGMYGLLNGALVSHSAFTNLPLSLVSRPLGLHTLGGGVVAVVGLAWAFDGRGITCERAVGVVVVGFFSGIWVRWYPLLPANEFPSADLPLVLAMAAGGLVILAGVGTLVGRMSLPDSDTLRLNRAEWIIVLGVLLLAFRSGSASGAISITDGAILGLLVGYMVIVLYFVQGQSRQSFVERLIPARTLNRWDCALLGTAFVAPIFVGYSLPGHGAEGMPLQALTASLTIFGAVWLPGVSLGVGLRSYIQLFREQG